MSNLGTYQLMTTLAKKVGGPEIFLLGLAVGGWVIGRSGEACIKAIVNKIKNGQRLSLDRQHLGKMFTIMVTTELTKGLKLNKGSEFYVLEQDHDSVLIVVSGDKDSPYFVSGKVLSKVSNYSPDTENFKEGAPIVNNVGS